VCLQPAVHKWPFQLAFSTGPVCALSLILYFDNDDDDNDDDDEKTVKVKLETCKN